MKRFFAVCLYISACCSVLQAETVMVGLRNDTGAGYLGAATILLASAVVEGAMEVFFEADHIVFDLGLPNEEREVLPRVEVSARIALAGGAGYMFDLKTGPPEEDSMVPEYVAYELTDLVANRVITAGVVRKSEINIKETDPVRICFLMGRKAASVAVPGLE